MVKVNDSGDYMTVPCSSTSLLCSNLLLRTEGKSLLCSEEFVGLIEMNVIHSSVYPVV
jgi:hypothetical protein